MYHQINPMTSLPCVLTYLYGRLSLAHYIEDMDNIDFSLDAWLPSPGFLWSYGEDEFGIYLPWLGVRKNWLVVVFPFARGLVSGAICVGVLLLLQQAARWRRSSGRCLKQTRNVRLPNPEPRPEPDGGEVPVQVLVLEYLARRKERLPFPQ